MEYQLIRSNRKTISLQVRPEGLIVRAPRRMGKAQIDQFVEEHRDWIEKHMAKVSQVGNMPKLTQEELKALVAQAKQTFPERVAFYAPLVGVSYGRITIRAQRTRWGSCSAQGSLNFNCLLMLAPGEVLDSVVVHELCHRKQMNHSQAFYSEVTRVFPDYHRVHGWLKEHGGELLARIP